MLKIKTPNMTEDGKDTLPNVQLPNFIFKKFFLKAKHFGLIVHCAFVRNRKYMVFFIFFAIWFLFRKGRVVGEDSVRKK